MKYSYCIHFDPSVVSRNLGDRIIRQGVADALAGTVPSLRVMTSYTQEAPGWKNAVLARRSAANFIGGTNCLTGRRLVYSMWKIGAPALLFGVKYTLLGVGWYRHDNRPDFLSSATYRRVLSRRFVHSCRDEYTAETVRSLGLKAINTGCPTMWGLSRDICKQIPQNKSNDVVFTLTGYNPDKHADVEMIRCLKDNYDRVFFWPQGLRDLDYLHSIVDVGRSSFEFLSPSVRAFETFLESHQCDYVGTRLHGGIKALQKLKRSLIISIDNRAAEISRDTGLPVLTRESIADLTGVVTNVFVTDIQLPWSSINEWKVQFKGLNGYNPVSP